MDVRTPKQQELPKPVHGEAPKVHEPAALPVHIEADDSKDEAPVHLAAVQRDRDVRRAQAAKAKPAGSRGVGLAVAATVIIVLGLGALFTYAYLRTNGIVTF